MADEIHPKSTTGNVTGGPVAESVRPAGILDDSDDHDGFPAEALDVLRDALAGFAAELPPEQLASAKSFLLDVMAAHPLGYLLSERLRDRPTTAQTEERQAQGSAIDEADESKRAGGAG